jgi:hypothetical protein
MAYLDFVENVLLHSQALFREIRKAEAASWKEDIFSLYKRQSCFAHLFSQQMSVCRFGMFLSGELLDKRRQTEQLRRESWRAIYRECFPFVCLCCTTINPFSTACRKMDYKYFMHKSTSEIKQERSPVLTNNIPVAQYKSHTSTE